MSYLANRLGKIEDRLSIKKRKKVFFWRNEPSVPGEREKSLQEEYT
ncbi:MAG: hypothetical protein GY839_18845 [candidate division Zixibacteria bacterium]|nr:hypothetical protein [candidate division Zixibacteria bacterium]